MSKKTVFVLWGVLFIVCAGLGFIPGFSQEVSGAVQGVLTALSLLFFAPPGYFLYQASREGDGKTLRLLRNLSAASLAGTVLVLILNVLSAFASETVGNVLHGILILVSTPMMCSGYWVLSLFLWACILMVSLSLLKKQRV